MAINKKLIHFNKKATFNSQKLSANEENNQYQVGGTGTVQTGAPDINYQSIVYIKDSKEIWTHGQFYGVGKNYYPGVGNGFGTTSSDVFSAFGSKEKYIAFRNDPSGYDGIRFGDAVYEFAGKSTDVVSNSQVGYITTLAFYRGVDGGVINSGAYPGFEFVNIWDELYESNDNGSPTVKTYSIVLPTSWYGIDRSPDNCIVTKKPLTDYIDSRFATIPTSPPVATSSALGGIKVGYTTSGKNYKVQLDDSNNAYVNVPWTDTTYTLPTASASTLGGVKVGNGLSTSNGVLSTGNYVSDVQAGSPSTDWQSAYVPLTVSYLDGSTSVKAISLPMVVAKTSDTQKGSAGLMYAADKKKLDSLSATPNMIKSRDSKVECDTSSDDITVYAPSAGVNITCKDPIGLTVSDEVVATFNVDSDLHADITLGGGYNNIHIKSGSSAGSGIIIQADDGVRITGSVEASGGFFDTSDARVKANVKEIDASDADKVKLVEFDRTDKEHHGYGVIAQELEKVYPEMVNTDSEGFKSVNYNELAMVKIKYLEDKVARLEALVGRLLAE